MTMEEEIQEVIKRLRKMPGVFAKERPRINALGGAYMASSLEAAAPRGNRIHKRYSTAKVNKRMRAPKGMGTVVATYYPSNLAMSEQVLKLNRAKAFVYVGAKLAKGNAKGTFGIGRRTDGYYLPMVHKRTPFVPQTVERSKNRIYKIMIDEYLRVIDKYKIDNGF